MSASVSASRAHCLSRRVCVVSFDYFGGFVLASALASSAPIINHSCFLASALDTKHMWASTRAWSIHVPVWASLPKLVDLKRSGPTSDRVGPRWADVDCGSGGHRFDQNRASSAYAASLHGRKAAIVPLPRLAPLWPHSATCWPIPGKIRTMPSEFRPTSAHSADIGPRRIVHTCVLKRVGASGAEFCDDSVESGRRTCGGGPA